MPYIFRLHNKDGYTQIDRNYRNLSFIDKLDRTIPARTSGVGGVSTRVVTERHNILAVRKTSNFINSTNVMLGVARMRPNSQGAASGGAVGRTTYVFVNTNSGGAQPVILYQFSPNFVASDTAGKPYKRIYDDNGVLVFDSGRFPMRVVASFAGNIPFNQGTAPDLTLYAPNNQRDYAVYMCKAPLHVVAASGVVRIGYFCFNQYDNGDGRWRFDFYMVYDQLSGSFNWDDKDPYCSVSIIDVTGN